MQCGQRAQFPGFKGGPGRKPLSTQRTVFNQEFYFKKESTPYVCFWILRHHCMHGLGVKNEKLAFTLQNFMKTRVQLHDFDFGFCATTAFMVFGAKSKTNSSTAKIHAAKFSSGPNQHLWRRYSLSESDVENRL